DPSNQRASQQGFGPVASPRFVRGEPLDTGGPPTREQCHPGACHRDPYRHRLPAPRPAAKAHGLAEAERRRSTPLPGSRGQRPAMTGGRPPPSLRTPAAATYVVIPVLVTGIHATTGSLRRDRPPSRPRWQKLTGSEQVVGWIAGDKPRDDRDVRPQPSLRTP